MNKFILLTLFCLALVVVGLEASVRGRRPSRDEEGETGQAGVNTRPSRRRWRGFRFNAGPRRRRPFRHHWPSWGLDFHFGLGSEETPEAPWYLGPNVCYSEDESTDDTGLVAAAITRHFSMKTETCDESDTVYKCTTTTVVNGQKNTTVQLYQCCHGYSRKQEEHGCPRDFELKDLVAAASDLELTEFVRAVQGIGLGGQLDRGNFTVFAPLNQAFQETPDLLPEVPDTLPQMNEPVVIVYTNPMNNFIVEDMRNTLLGHMVAGIHKTGSLEDEEVLETGSPYKSKIRINFYNQPEKMMTANCKRVVSKDNEATRGVIHVVEDILHPVTDSLLDIVSKDPNLSYMKTALGRSQLGRLLREDGQYTLLAPTDNAFNKMDERVRQRLFSGEACLEKFIKHTLLPNVICSSVIQGRVKTTNLNEQQLPMSRDDDEKLFVGHAQIIDRDVMATNGVLHIIDDVIIPDEALSILDLIQKNNNSRFVELVRMTGLTTELSESQNLTLFLPSKEAMEDFEEAMRHGMMEDIISYHISTSSQSCRSYWNNLMLPTLEEGKDIRINEYFNFGRSWIQTAQCAPIIKKNIRACNGQIQIVNKVLIPPIGNVVDVLALRPEFSKMIMLFKQAELADMLQEEGPFTVFAMTNEVIDNLDEDHLEAIANNRTLLKIFMKNHISEGATCCAGITGNDWFNPQRIMMASGNVFKLGRSYENDVTVGPAAVEKCDLSATNGVIHVINRPLASKTTGRRWKHLERFFDRFFDSFDFI